MEQASNAVAESGAERRTADRRRTLKAATVVYNGGHTSLDCTIKDVSETGAKIEMHDLITLPETFHLYFRAC